MNRLIRVLEATDPELAAHSHRSARLAADIGRFLGLDNSQVQRLDAAARLHDIGKLVIPREILDKPGPLTSREWTEMKRHPETGYDLVRMRVPTEVAEIVLTHHERYDGAGYPYGINGSDIPVEARILQVADAFDAITSDRPYQPALSVDYAIAELTRCAGTQFDPDAVAALIGLNTQAQWLIGRGHVAASLSNVAV